MVVTDNAIGYTQQDDRKVQLNSFHDDDDDMATDNWRQNILVIGGMVLVIAGLVALAYCCCRACVEQPGNVTTGDPTSSQGLVRQGTSRDNERYPRDSFYNPPPRYSFLYRSFSQRRARMSALRKRREEEDELPRYSSALRQLSQDALDRAQYAATVATDNGVNNDIIGTGDLGSRNTTVDITDGEQRTCIDSPNLNDVRCAVENTRSSQNGHEEVFDTISADGEVLSPGDQTEEARTSDHGVTPLPCPTLLVVGSECENPPRYSAIVGTKKLLPPTNPPRYSDVMQTPNRPELPS